MTTAPGRLGVRPVAVALALAGLLGACGDDAVVADADARTIAPLDADALPATVLGLDIEREDISEILDATKRPYLEAASLYSMREEDELQATLQIGRFADGTAYEDEEFRATLLNTVGGGAVRELRVGDDEVFLTTGDRQQIAIWFRGQDLLILSTREEFERPRTLLREALGLQP